MQASRIACACVIAAAGVMVPAASLAQTQARDARGVQGEVEQLRQELMALRTQFDERIAALESKLADAEQRAAPQPVAAIAQGTAPPATSGALQPIAAGQPGSKIFNPDIAVIGDFLGTAGRTVVDPQPALAMHETEASFQAVVDPYARADFFIAVGDEGVELEEGFITFPAVPGGLLVKVGKQRAAFGKVNTFHTHALSWADRPLVTTNLVNGEEGISDAGVSVARLIPNPWVFLEAVGQVYRGDSGDLFQSSTRRDLAYVGRLRGYHDLSESTNIDLGASYARGRNNSGALEGFDAGRSITQLTGLDATLRWRPLRRSIYRSFIGRSEVIWSRRQQPADAQAGAMDRATERAFGYYVSGDYQFARRWFAGARIDWSERAEAASLRDRGHSLLLTYRPSEFSLVRGQYRRTRYADAPEANEFLFQFQFSIGAHGAHAF